MKLWPADVENIVIDLECLPAFLGDDLRNPDPCFDDLRSIATSISRASALLSAIPAELLETLDIDAKSYEIFRGVDVGRGKDRGVVQL